MKFHDLMSGFIRLDILRHVVELEICRQRTIEELGPARIPVEPGHEAPALPAIGPI